MAMTFTGGQYDQLASGSSSLQNVNAATLALWVTINALPNSSQHFMCFSAGNTIVNPRAFIGIIKSGSNKYFYAGGRCLDADATQQYSLGAATFSVGGRYHCAATFDFSNKIIRLYQDGALQGTSGALGWGAAPTSNTASTNVIIACFIDGFTWNAEITAEDVRAYDRLLSSDEIASIYYARGGDRNLYGIKHWYQLAEGYNGQAAAGASLIKDSGPLQINATPSGNPTWAEQRTKRRAFTLVDHAVA